VNVFVQETKVHDLAIPPVTFNLNIEALCSASLQWRKSYNFCLIKDTFCVSSCVGLLCFLLYKNPCHHIIVGTILTFFLRLPLMFVLERADSPASKSSLILLLAFQLSFTKGNRFCAGLRN